MLSLKKHLGKTLIVTLVIVVILMLSLKSKNKENFNLSNPMHYNQERELIKKEEEAKLAEAKKKAQEEKIYKTNPKIFRK